MPRGGFRKGAGRRKKGAVGGPRPGSGRKPGSPNKKTINRRKEEAAKVLAVEAENRLRQGRGDKLATEVLDDFMRLFIGLARRHQPWPDEDGKNPLESVTLFEKYSRLAIQCASELGNYQQPKFRAIMVSVQPGQAAHSGALLPPIIDNYPQPAPSDDDQSVPEKEGNVISLNDTAALTLVYRQRIQRFG